MSIYRILLSSFIAIVFLLSLPAQNIEMEITVKDDYTETPLESALVSILMDGTVVTSAYTNADGIAEMTVTVTSVGISEGLPSSMTLSSNYPNPFGAETNVELGMPDEGMITATVYNILGQNVLSERLPVTAGYHTLNISMGGLPMGVYFLQIEGKASKAIKLLKVGAGLQPSRPMFSITQSNIPGVVSLSKLAEEMVTVRVEKDSYDTFETEFAVSEVATKTIELSRNNTVEFQVLDGEGGSVAVDLNIVNDDVDESVSAPGTLTLKSGFYHITGSVDESLYLDRTVEIVSVDTVIVLSYVEQQLIGSWLGEFDEAIEGPGDEDCNAMYFEFDETGNFTLLSFMDGDQVGGHLGSYAFDVEDGLILDITHGWSDEHKDWGEMTHLEMIPITVSSDGTILSFSDSLGTVVFELQKISRSLPEEIEGGWLGSSLLLILEDTGEFELFSPDGIDRGSIHMLTRENEIDFLLFHITESNVEADGECNIYALFGYGLNTEEDSLTIWFGDFEAVLAKLNTVDGDELEGNWLAILDEVTPGPGNADSDAIYFEFDNEGNFLLLSFLESNPAAGHRGTYTYRFEGLLQIDISHDWVEAAYNWTPVVDNMDILFIGISADRDTLAVGPPGGEPIVMHKTTPSVPEELVAHWVTDGATLIIDETGAFTYAEGADTSSGTLIHIDDIDGVSYMLSHTTYCDFVAGADSDYYTLNRYEINAEGTELTLWHGEDELVFDIVDLIE